MRKSFKTQSDGPPGLSAADASAFIVAGCMVQTVGRATCRQSGAGPSVPAFLSAWDIGGYS